MQCRLHLIYVILPFIFTACKGPNQPKDQEKAIGLMKEGTDFMLVGMRTEFSDSITSAASYRLAVSKFLEAIKLDPDNKKLGLYLPDVYSKLRISDSVTYWRSWLNPEDR